ncbi:MAG: alkaline phosphatase family protein, partial [Thermoanaerobaculia bacterium]
SFSHPYFFLDHDVIAANKLDLAEVEDTNASAVVVLNGVALAVPSSSFARAVGETDAQLIAKVRRNYHPDRSGDVYVVQNAQWQVDSGKSPELQQHGSPWTYDAFVPVAFAGYGVSAQKVMRDISTVDVAATLASVLRTKFPSGCVGVPLPEVFDSH